MHFTTYSFQTSSMPFLFFNLDIEFEFHGRHVVDYPKLTMFPLHLYVDVSWYKSLKTPQE